MKSTPSSAIHPEQPSMLHAGDSSGTFCGQKWPPDHMPLWLVTAERHRVAAPVGHGVKQVPSCSLSKTKTLQVCKIKLCEDEGWGTQDPTGKHPFPKIPSEGHSLPSVKRSCMAYIIIIPVISAPTLIWGITCKQRQRDGITATAYGVSQPPTLRSNILSGTHFYGTSLGLHSSLHCRWVFSFKDQFFAHFGSWATCGTPSQAVLHIILAL